MTDIDTQATELVERTCAEQGVPAIVEDDATLDRVAAVVRSTREERRAS